MSESPILAISEIGPTQTNKYRTHNDAIAHLEASTNDILTNASVGAGPVVLTELQATTFFVYALSGATGPFELVFPSVINLNNAKRVFSVRNADTTHSCTVRAATGTGATVILTAGTSAVIYQSFESVYVVSDVSTGAVQPYDVGVYVPDRPDDGAELLKFTAVRPFQLADNLSGSRGHAGTNPTSTAVFPVKRNDIGIGTVSISTGGVVTFTTIGSTVESFVPGDRLSLDAPAPQDLTLANVSIVFRGSRT